MTYPTAYTRQYDFKGYQNANPKNPLPGDKANTELEAIEDSIGEVIAFIEGIARSDGALANGVVTWDSLSATVQALLGQGEIVQVPFTIADEATAEAGTNNDSMMTPLRTAQAIIAQLLDEDDMVSDSDVAAPTQQSVKAYVDTVLGSVMDDQTANLVLAGPASGADDTPAYRALVSADIPTQLATDRSFTGNVGIGSLPNANTALDVTKSSDSTAYASSITASVQASDLMRFYNKHAAADQVSLYMQAQGASGRIVLDRTGVNTADLAWQLRNGGASTAEVMRVTAAGALSVLDIAGSRANYGLGSVSVFDYGAKPSATGSTNITSFQSAVNAVVAALGIVSTTISTTNTSTSATVASATGLAVGQYIKTANVPGGTVISALSGTTVTLSNAATATASGTAALFGTRFTTYLNVPAGDYAGDLSSLSYGNADAVVFRHLGQVKYTDGAPKTPQMFSERADGNGRFVPSYQGHLVFNTDSALLGNAESFGSYSVYIRRNSTYPAAQGGTGVALKIDHTTDTGFTGRQYGISNTVTRNCTSAVTDTNATTADIVALSVSNNDHATHDSGSVRLGLDIQASDWYGADVAATTSGQGSSVSGSTNTIEASIQCANDDDFNNTGFVDSTAGARKVMSLAIKNLLSSGDTGYAIAYAGCAMMITNQNASVGGEAWFKKGLWISPKVNGAGTALANGGVQTGIVIDDVSTTGLLIREQATGVSPTTGDIRIQRVNASPTVHLYKGVTSGNIALIQYRALNASSVEKIYATLLGAVATSTAGSEQGSLTVQTILAGTNTNIATFKKGIAVGAPTGSVDALGVINVAADIYKNGTAYTNPDYAFEQYYTGGIVKFADREGASAYADRLKGRRLIPLDELREYVSKNWRLPGISDEAMGAFARSDFTLENIEQLYLYQFEAADRIAALEQRLTRHGL